MTYQPKSEEQLVKEGLLPDGEYDFEVLDTDDKPSKTSGNAMFTLKQNFFAEDGSGHIVTTYIALGSNFGERLLRHAADTCGLIDIYNSGNLTPADFRDRNGRAKIKIQEGNKEYPNPKNVVVDYITKPVPESVETGALPPEKPKKKAAAPLDDEIPF